MRRLLLVRHAPTAATRASAFPSDEPLDERGWQAAERLAAVLPSEAETLSSPALRCRQTAAAAGLKPQLAPEIGDCDFGAWTGRTLAHIHAADPVATRAWMTDPDARPHGGESLTEFARRVAAWLDVQSKLEGRAIAVTHAAVVRGALVHALGAPIQAFWRFDASPLGITELHSQDGRWTISRVNCGGRRKP